MEKDQVPSTTNGADEHMLVAMIAQNAQETTATVTPVPMTPISKEVTSPPTSDEMDPSGMESVDREREEEKGDDIEIVMTANTVNQDQQKGGGAVETVTVAVTKAVTNSIRSNPEPEPEPKFKPQRQSPNVVLPVGGSGEVNDSVIATEPDSNPHSETADEPQPESANVVVAVTVSRAKKDTEDVVESDSNGTDPEPKMEEKFEPKVIIKVDSDAEPQNVVNPEPQKEERPKSSNVVAVD